MESLQNTPSPAIHQSHFMQLVLILFLSMLGTMIGGAIVSLLEGNSGIEYQTVIQNLQENSPVAEKNFIKSSLGISHLFTFILPSVVFLWIVYQRNWISAIKLATAPKFGNAILGALYLLIAFPLVQFIYALNRQLPLPEWAIEQENLINQTLEALLFVQSPNELFFNLFIVAILPAIGEELLFRGIVQQTLEKSTKNPHIAVLLTAFIFSFIHFQFQGFFPRVLLGIILGYLFVRTRNLWIPIIAHFVYNAGQVFLQYAHQKGILGFDLTEVEAVPIWLVISSLVGVLLLEGYFSKNTVD